MTKSNKLERPLCLKFSSLSERCGIDKELCHNGFYWSYDNKNFETENYWESRYEKGHGSGSGSHGELAKFKAKVINNFFRIHKVKSVIDYGCGDGTQLSLLYPPEYVGIDVSATAVKICKEKYFGDNMKTFFLDKKFFEAPQKAELVLSLDVIFHLIEDEVFENYMKNLFNLSDKYCLIYSSNINLSSEASHVRHRCFTEWVEDNIKGWELFGIRYNDFPYKKIKNTKLSSFSDFYFYRKSDL